VGAFGLQFTAVNGAASPVTALLNVHVDPADAMRYAELPDGAVRLSGSVDLPTSGTVSFDGPWSGGCDVPPSPLTVWSSGSAVSQFSTEVDCNVTGQNPGRLHIDCTANFDPRIAPLVVPERATFGGSLLPIGPVTSGYHIGTTVLAAALPPNLASFTGPADVSISFATDGARFTSRLQAATRNRYTDQGGCVQNTQLIASTGSAPLSP
jgi:hypothetical protein